MVDFFDLSAFGLEASVALVSEAASVFLGLALSDFLDASSVLFFSLVLLVLVFGEVAALSGVGLVFVADSAGLFAVEAGAGVAVAAGLVAVAWGWICGVPIGEAFGEAAGVALAAGVMVAAAVALAAGVAATVAVAAGVALGRVDALVLEVVVAPVVVPEVEVMPTLKFGTVTP